MEFESRTAAIQEEAVKIYKAYTDAYNLSIQIGEDAAAVETDLNLQLDKRSETYGFLNDLKISRKINKLFRKQDRLGQDSIRARLALIEAESAGRRSLLNNRSTYFDAALLDASEAGVEIETINPDHLARADWRNKNVEVGKTALSLVEKYSLDTLTDDELENNLLAYPEMQWEFTDIELESARQVVSNIPLTHITRATAYLDKIIENGPTEGLQTCRQLRAAG